MRNDVYCPVISRHVVFAQDESLQECLQLSFQEVKHEHIIREPVKSIESRTIQFDEGACAYVCILLLLKGTFQGK